MAAARRATAAFSSLMQTHSTISSMSVFFCTHPSSPKLKTKIKKIYTTNMQPFTTLHSCAIYSPRLFLADANALDDIKYIYVLFTCTPISKTNKKHEKTFHPAHSIHSKFGHCGFFFAYTLNVINNHMETLCLPIFFSLSYCFFSLLLSRLFSRTYFPAFLASLIFFLFFLLLRCSNTMRCACCVCAHRTKVEHLPQDPNNPSAERVSS